MHRVTRKDVTIRAVVMKEAAIACEEFGRIVDAGEMVEHLRRDVLPG